MGVVRATLPPSLPFAHLDVWETARGGRRTGFGRLGEERSGAATITSKPSQRPYIMDDTRVVRSELRGSSLPINLEVIVPRAERGREKCCHRWNQKRHCDQSLRQSSSLSPALWSFVTLHHIRLVDTKRSHTPDISLWDLGKDTFLLCTELAASCHPRERVASRRPLCVLLLLLLLVCWPNQLLGHVNAL